MIYSCNNINSISIYNELTIGIPTFLSINLYHFNCFTSASKYYIINILEQHETVNILLLVMDISIKVFVCLHGILRCFQQFSS